MKELNNIDTQVESIKKEQLKIENHNTMPDDEKAGLLKNCQIRLTYLASMRSQLINSFPVVYEVVTG